VPKRDADRPDHSSPPAARSLSFRHAARSAPGLRQVDGGGGGACTPCSRHPHVGPRGGASKGHLQQLRQFHHLKQSIAAKVRCRLVSQQKQRVAFLLGDEDWPHQPSPNIISSSLPLKSVVWEVLLTAGVASELSGRAFSAAGSGSSHIRRSIIFIVSIVFSDDGWNSSKSGSPGSLTEKT
jgi:hypothetical protein